MKIHLFWNVTYPLLGSVYNWLKLITLIKKNCIERQWSIFWNNNFSTKSYVKFLLQIIGISSENIQERTSANFREYLSNPPFVNTKTMNKTIKWLASNLRKYPKSTRVARTAYLRGSGLNPGSFLTPSFLFIIQGWVDCPLSLHDNAPTDTHI